MAGLFLLMSVGLAIFGVTMYELYSSSQYRQLSADLKNAVPLVSQELAQKAGVDLPRPNPGYGPSSNYDPSTQYRPEGAGYGQGSYAPGTTGSTTVSGRLPVTSRQYRFAPAEDATVAGRGRHRRGAAGPWWVTIPGRSRDLWRVTGQIRTTRNLRAAGKFHRRPAYPQGAPG